MKYTNRRLNRLFVILFSAPRCAVPSVVVCLFFLNPVYSITNDLVPDDPGEVLLAWDGKTPLAPNGPGNLQWLKTVPFDSVKDIKDSTLQNRANYISSNLLKYHQRFGLVWKARFRDPTDEVPLDLGPGSDSALFSGFYLAASTYRFRSSKRPEDLQTVLETLKGMYLLTHVSGTSGVLVRCVYPLEPPHNLWENRKSKKYIYIQNSFTPYPDYLNVPDCPPVWFYAKTTRDQLTGVLFGLAVTWLELANMEVSDDAELQSTLIHAKKLIYTITKDLHTRLSDTNFTIRDQKGRSGTTAKKVDGYLRLQLLSLYRRIVIDLLEDQKNKGLPLSNDLIETRRQVRNAYDSYFKWVLTKGFVFDHLQFFNHLSQYYAWNLRITRSYSIFMCDTNYSRRAKIFFRTRRSLWESGLPFSKYPIKEHQNTFITFLYFDIWQSVWNNKQLYRNNLKLSESSDSDNPLLAEKYLERALWQLKGLSLRPLRSWATPLDHGRQDFRGILPVYLRTPTQHFIWQKPPDYLDPDRNNTGRSEATGIDFLLPYWMGKVKFPEKFTP